MQKIIIKIVFFLLILVLWFNMAQAKSLTAVETLARLQDKISTDPYYQRWVVKDCLTFVIESKSPDYLDIALREKGQCGLAKDSQTMPLLNRFRVSRRDGKVSCFYYLDGSYTDYEQCQKE